MFVVCFWCQDVTWMLSVDDPDAWLATGRAAKLQQVQVMAIQSLTNHQQLHTCFGLGPAAAAEHRNTVNSKQSSIATLPGTGTEYMRLHACLRGASLVCNTACAHYAVHNLMQQQVLWHYNVDCRRRSCCDCVLKPPAALPPAMCGAPLLNGACAALITYNIHLQASGRQKLLLSSFTCRHQVRQKLLLSKHVRQAAYHSSFCATAFMLQLS